MTNMIAGYAFIDRTIAERTDLFAMGYSKQLLALNRLVLVGDDPERANEMADHLQATEAHFYAETGGGVRDVMEWYKLNQGDSVWRRAAGVYIRVLSEPQLFIEGNHRSGALLMSYLLAREGRPPFVLTVDNAKPYFDPSTLMRHTRKHSLAALYRIPKLKKQFAKFLQEQSRECYLEPADAA